MYDEVEILVKVLASTAGDFCCGRENVLAQDLP